jgi:hydrogenase maturation factor
MRLVIEGRPNKLIADALDISVRTVEVHRARVFDKMNVKSAVELANRLRDSGRAGLKGQRMPGEFELIARHFTRPCSVPPWAWATTARCCARRRACSLAVSSDMLVEGRHFLSTVAPERLGHKALAVNLSDLAACGAEPLAFTLALALPRADDAFLAPLARGMLALADAHGIELVGGDTTAGPLNLCITVFGQVPPGQALLRSGAAAGDDIWVSGQLGDARLALEVFRGTLVCRARPSRPCAARWSCRSRVWRWAWRCAAWPAAPSTSATAWWATWAMSCSARASAPWCRWTSCRAARAWPRSPSRAAAVPAGRG